MNILSETEIIDAKEHKNYKNLIATSSVNNKKFSNPVLWKLFFMLVGIGLVLDGVGGAQFTDEQKQVMKKCSQSVNKDKQEYIIEAINNGGDNELHNRFIQFCKNGGQVKTSNGNSGDVMEYNPKDGFITIFNEAFNKSHKYFQNILAHELEHSIQNHSFREWVKLRRVKKISILTEQLKSSKQNRYLTEDMKNGISKILTAAKDNSNMDLSPIKSHLDNIHRINNNPNSTELIKELTKIKEKMEQNNEPTDLINSYLDKIKIYQQIETESINKISKGKEVDIARNILLAGARVAFVADIVPVLHTTQKELSRNNKNTDYSVDMHNLIEASPQLKKAYEYFKKEERQYDKAVSKGGNNKGANKGPKQDL